MVWANEDDECNGDDFLDDRDHRSDICMCCMRIQASHDEAAALSQDLLISPLDAAGAQDDCEHAAREVA